jgi:hypothetical protein
VFLETVPIFRRPETVPQEQYGEALKAHAAESRAYVGNLLRQIHLVEYIREQVGWFADDPESIEVQILATGSDGRDEKATFVPGRLNGKDSFVPQHLHEAAIPSSMNVIAVMGVKDVPAGQSDVEHAVDTMLADRRDEIMQLMERELMQLGLFEQMEVKSVYAETPSGYLDNPEDPWPSRIFDTVPLTENGGLEMKLRQAYLRELQSDGRTRKLREREANRAKQYRKVCTGGERAGHQLRPGMQYVSASAGVVTHFDLDAGIAYYDRNNNIASFKYGPLRTVQMHVSLLIISLLGLQQSGTNAVALTHELPRSIADKLGYLQDHNLLQTSPETVRRLTDNYQFFLQLYHRSEWESAAHNSVAASFADDAGSRQEVRERLADLAEDAQALKARQA